MVFSWAAAQQEMTSKLLDTRNIDIRNKVPADPRHKAQAVVLLSGGMDSCVCAALAVRDYDAAALHVSYGQRTEKRERQARPAARLA